MGEGNLGNELASFIDETYRQPYSLLSNNCIHKSLRIKARAEKLGKSADLIGCLSILPVRRWHNFPIISPHVYLEVEGEKIDVSLDPHHEEIFCPNNEKRVVMPVNISRLRRTFCHGK